MLYGPDGRPILSAEEKKTDVKKVKCSYCPRIGRLIRVKKLVGGNHWALPAGWRKLPNGMLECPGCRPVRDVRTGQMVRRPRP